LWVAADAASKIAPGNFLAVLPLTELLQGQCQIGRAGSSKRMNFQTIELNRLFRKICSKSKHESGKQETSAGRAANCCRYLPPEGKEEFKKRCPLISDTAHCQKHCVTAG
jgi:hypothetical protein